MMKMKLGSIVVILVLALLPAVPVSAASRTVILKPTNASLAYVKVYLDGSTSPDFQLGGGGTDLNNALLEDGQLALLDPELPGPGPDSPAGSSILALNYEKNIICPSATVQSTEVHVIWKADGTSEQGNDFGVLVKADNTGVNSFFSVNVDTSNGNATQSNSFFGGLAISSSIEGGTFSGNVPTVLTHDSSATQLPASAADLNDPESRIVIAIGDGYLTEGGTDPIFLAGSVDYAYLEVTYDDSNCLPGGIDTASVSGPKTGAVLTASIIGAALLAGIGASLFGIKRTKLKHRASERE